MQDCSNSSALAMELLQSCAKPSAWYYFEDYWLKITTASPRGQWVKHICRNVVGNPLSWLPCTQPPSHHIHVEKILTLGVHTKLLYHFSTQRWHILFKSHLVDGNVLFIVHNQYNNCWCSNNARIQRISRIIVVLCVEYCGFSSRMVDWYDFVTTNS